jgi:two-component system sensor histidine kinase DctS
MKALKSTFISTDLASVVDVINHAALNFKEILCGVKIDVEVEVCGKLPKVNINTTHVEMLILNLMRNIADAMQAARMDQGHIWLSADMSENGGHVVITVKDDGPGLAANIESQVFYPFTSTKTNGFGLGLTISRSLIEDHGGRLCLKPHDGQGVMFKFTLPVVT